MYNLRYSTAILRSPCENMIKGITTATLGQPNYDVALKQHTAYIQVLDDLGLTTDILEKDNNFPDSCFVEDTAIVSDKMAIITLLGALTRRGEQIAIHKSLKSYFEHIEVIKPPGTVEGGDVMRIEDNYYIGLSKRTNLDGASQLKSFLEQEGYSVSFIKFSSFLHLKTGVNYLGDGILIAGGEFVQKQEFQKFEVIEVPISDIYSANSLRVNNVVITPVGFTQTRIKLENYGFDVIEINISEFQKLDGGLSCLSLRF